MAAKFSKLMTDTNPQIQEAQGKPTGKKTKRTTYRHVVFKPWKTKDSEKILKGARGGGKIPYVQRNRIRISLEFIS